MRIHKIKQKKNNNNNNNDNKNKKMLNLVSLPIFFKVPSKISLILSSNFQFYISHKKNYLFSQSSRNKNKNLENDFKHFKSM